MIYLYHIRKTGGRSIIHSFMNLATSKPERFYEKLARQPGHRLAKGGMTFVGWEPATIKQGGFFFGFSHTPAHALNVPNGTTLTCLRDPLDRIKSYFNYLMDIKAEVARNPQHVHANMPDLKWAHDNPIKFLAAAPRIHILNQLYMFSKALDSQWAADNIARCDHILSAATLRTDIEKLGDKLKLALRPMHVGKSKSRCKFSDTFEQAARELLKPEYEMLDILRQRGRL